MICEKCGGECKEFTTITEDFKQVIVYLCMECYYEKTEINTDCKLFKA